MTWTRPLLLFAAPVAVVLLLWLHRVRWGRVRRLLSALGGAAGSRPGRGHRVPVLVAAGCLGLALAGPVGPGPAPAPESARPDVQGAAATVVAAAGAVDVVLAVDVSRSMGALDGAPDRASAARMAALRVATLEGISRVGLVAFAAAAHLLVPPTGDRGLVLLHLDGLTPDALTAQGTDLAAALQAAVDALPPAELGRRRAVVLISDGEGFQEDNALAAAAARAGREAVAVHAVVVGTPEGAQVPGRAGQSTRARPEVLRRVARETGGLAASAAGGEVSALLAELGGAQAAPGLRGGAGRSGEGARGLHLAPALALVALLALLGDAARTGGIRRRVS